MSNTKSEVELVDIWKFSQNPYVGASIVSVRVTRDAAKEHCSRPDTTGDGWFDGFNTHDPDLVDEFPELVSADPMEVTTRVSSA